MFKEAQFVGLVKFCFLWTEQSFPYEFHDGPFAVKPTDPQIANITYTADVIDVTAAKQALSKSKNKEVVASTKNMVCDDEAPRSDPL